MRSEKTQSARRLWGGFLGRWRWSVDREFVLRLEVRERDVGGGDAAVAARQVQQPRLSAAIRKMAQHDENREQTKHSHSRPVSHTSLQSSSSSEQQQQQLSIRNVFYILSRWLYQQLFDLILRLFFSIRIFFFFPSYPRPLQSRFYGRIENVFLSTSSPSTMRC